MRVNAPIQIVAHGEGWHDIPYIRLDVHQAQIVARDAKLEEIRQVVRRWIDSKDRDLDNGGGMLEIINILYPPPSPTGDQKGEQL